MPAPRRGELVRLLGEELRREKEALGALVTLEAGKIVQEGLGEVQEMIDICDFAVGLSRQLYGLTIASERPGHRMFETWHPLGPIGVITAFNFPVAVWSWNSALALACGDPVVWKPSSLTPLTALACRSIFERAAERFGDAPGGARRGGGGRRGPRRSSTTRGCRSSRRPARRRWGARSRLASPRRLARSVLELGGNNGMIVAPTADLDLAVRAIVFAAVGTAGQRCTSLRRLIVHESVADGLLERLERAYASVGVGDPREPGTLCGPLISEDAFTDMQAALDRARAEGAAITGGDRVLADEWPDAYYVRPAIARMPHQTDLVREETFAPLLYAVTYSDLDEAIAAPQRRPAGPLLVRLHRRPARERAVPVGRGLGLRDRERQHRPERRRDRRGVRRREGDRRRTRVGIRRLEGLHAPPDRDDQLLDRAPLAQGIVFDV